MVHVQLNLILSDTLLTESIYDTYCIAQLNQADD